MIYFILFINAINTVFNEEIINRFRNILDYQDEKSIIIGQYSEMICYYNEIHKY